MTLTFPSIGTSLGDLVTTTERQYLGAARTRQMNKLDAAIADSTATTITLTYDLEGIRPGTYLQIDDESFYVWSTNTVAKTAVVERAQLGSTGEAHADNSLVVINPRFHRIQIAEAIRQEIQSWPPQLYGVLNAVIDTTLQDVDTQISGLEFYQGLRLLAVEYGTDSGQWAQVRTALDSASLVPHWSDAGIIDGYSLRWRGGSLDFSIPIRLRIGAHFQPMTGGFNTDVGGFGLTPTMLDIPPIGAAARLLFPEEINNTDTVTQGGTRTSEESPPGHKLQTAGSLMQWREQRISEEILRLVSDFPWLES